MYFRKASVVGRSPMSTSTPTTGRGFWGDLGDTLLKGLDTVTKFGLDLISPELGGAYENVKKDIREGKDALEVFKDIGTGFARAIPDVLDKATFFLPELAPVAAGATALRSYLDHPNIGTALSGAATAHSIARGDTFEARQTDPIQEATDKVAGALGNIFGGGGVTPGTAPQPPTGAAGRPAQSRPPPIFTDLPGAYPADSPVEEFYTPSSQTPTSSSIAYIPTTPPKRRKDLAPKNTKRPRSANASASKARR